jgi:hypothetical protein
MSADIKSLAMSVLQKHGAVSTQSQHIGASETAVRLPEIAPVAGVRESVHGSTPGIELPTRRCGACNSWLYWVSVYGVVMCSTCHPPANRDLVKTWHWLPEGESKKTQ